MWEPTCPDVSARLRQGDLLQGVEVPSKGSIVSSYAVVVDNCCTIEQQHAVMVARVGSRKKVQPGSPTDLALRAVDPTADGPYTPYEHLLEGLEGHLTVGAKIPVVKLVDRALFSAADDEGLLWLTEKRVARMTVQARVRLRAKVGVHFARGVDEDTAWLEKNGLDSLGRPIPE